MSAAPVNVLVALLSSTAFLFSPAFAKAHDPNSVLTLAGFELVTPRRASDLVVVGKVLTLDTAKYPPSFGTALKDKQYTGVELRVMSRVWGEAPETLLVNLSTTIYRDGSGCPSTVGGSSPVIWVKVGDTAVFKLRRREGPALKGNFDVRQVWLVDETQAGQVRISRQTGWSTGFTHDGCDSLATLGTGELFGLVKREVDVSSLSLNQFISAISDYYHGLVEK